MSLVMALKKETKSEEGEPQVFQKGDYVVPKKAAPKKTTEGGFMVEARKKGYVGKVAYIDSFSKDYATISFSVSDVTPKGASAQYHIEDLTVISQEEGLRIEKEMKKSSIDAYLKAEVKFTKELCPKRVLISQRSDYLITSKNYLDTNLNFIKLYNHGVTEDKNPKGGGTPYVDARCCSLTRTTAAPLIYIPKIWMSYFGYNLIDLNAWLRFLGYCKIGFKAHYLGEETLGKGFGVDNIQTRVPVMTNNNLISSPDTECYKVLLEPGSTSGLTYMRFILIRYIYNSQYWTIPAMAMQIKKGLKTAITHWEALLIAHLMQDFYAYYALMANSGGNVALPIRANAPDKIVANAEKGGSMNGTFTLTKISNIDNIRAAIRTKNYEAILGFVKEWRKL
jgi:hypothetical protein